MFKAFWLSTPWQLQFRKLRLCRSAGLAALKQLLHSGCGQLINRCGTYQEYIRGRLCNSRSFCYGCCHSRISSSSSLPTSVCPKIGNTFILERWAERWTLYIGEQLHAKEQAKPELAASQNDRVFRESEHARVERWVHNNLKREWLCVIDDALEILPWQTATYGIAYSSSYVLFYILSISRSNFSQFLEAGTGSRN